MIVFCYVIAVSIAFGSGWAFGYFHYLGHDLDMASKAKKKREREFPLPGKRMESGLRAAKVPVPIPTIKPPKTL